MPRLFDAPLTVARYAPAMDPCFLHRDPWPADDLAQVELPPALYSSDGRMMEAASARVAEALDRAADDGGYRTVGPRQ